MTARRRRTRRSSWRRRVIPVLVAAAVLASLSWLALTVPYGDGGSQFRIRRGMSLVDIGGELQRAGAVSHRMVFLAAAALSGDASRLQPGVYRFPEGMSAADVVSHLASGRFQVEIRVTIPEGSTIRQIAGILRRTLDFDSAAFVALCADPGMIRKYQAGGRSLEGYLLPDTYFFRPDVTPERVISRLRDALDAAISPSLRSRMRVFGWSLHQTLTMASLVEGETSLASERARVSGVYHNRLRRGMLLQADPTIQYIIHDGPRRLLYRDLRIDSPYNTYRYRGLPPGPVNNPGREAIRAALHPEQHAYLYFVATGDGGHTFSVTHEQHVRAVRDYRARRDQRARESGGGG